MLNHDHMIEEIQDNIAMGDRMKARLVLDHIGEVDEKVRDSLVSLLCGADAEFAVPLFLHLLNCHATVSEEMPVIRQTLLSMLLANPEMLLRFMENPAIENRKELFNIAADLKLEEATPVLITILSNSTEESEILSLVNALGQIGDAEATNILTEYLYAANREVIGTAIHSLGLVGTPTAMHRLAERMGTDNEIDAKILSIFAEVQDQVSLEKLSETLGSHHAHMRTYAKKELARIGAKAVPLLLENLNRTDPDFLIHTLNVLGDIGDESAVVPIRKFLQNEPKSANVRFAAYEALALLPLRKGAYTLAAGLLDMEEHVGVAAARAIDQNYSDILAAGIKNMLRNKGEEALHITKIIVNAQVDKIFLSLAPEQFFQEMALTYLLDAHRDIRHHYHQLLVQDGQREFAEKFAGDLQEVARPKVMAVDDSRMILNIYKTTLHELGYDPVLFEFPASALTWLQDEKPAMVLTDLNMPDMTGIEFTAAIRKKYSVKELPVIMVTTQNEMNDNEAAQDAGVNLIIHKPFNAQSLQAAMDEFIE